MCGEKLKEEVMVHIDKGKCIGCGLCCNDCASFILELKNDKANMVAEYCLLCGHCVAICPKNAVSIDDYDMSEVVEHNDETFGIEENVMLNTIKFRRSIRSFKEIQVEKEKIEKILEAGRYSPTGSNSQNVSYIVVQNDIPVLRGAAMGTLKEIIEAGKRAENSPNSRIIFNKIDLNNEDFLFKDAPTLILVVSDSDVNASIASANMELVANSQKLGMLYVGFFTYIANNSSEIKELLGLMSKQRIVTCLAIGYPNVQYKRTVPRKKVQVQWR